MKKEFGKREVKTSLQKLEDEKRRHEGQSHVNMALAAKKQCKQYIFF